MSPSAVRRGLNVSRARSRDLSWRVADTLRSIRIGDPHWVPALADRAQWEEHGWLRLPGSVPADVIDLVVGRIGRYRHAHHHQTTNPRTGESLRVGLLHEALREVREVALNDQVRAFLRWAFADEPVLFGSLTFEVGSEQEAHIDAAFFYTRPTTSMAGVWTAFEDVDEDAGPLFVIDGSHRWPPLMPDEALGDEHLRRRVEEHRRRGGEPDLELSAEVYLAYIAALHDRIEARKADPMPVRLKKGDVFIWHPWLVHGGMPRVDRARTRRSLVTHFIGASAPMWDQHSFFLYGTEVVRRTPLTLSVRTSRGRPYVRHDGAVHFSQGDGHFEA